MDRSSSRDEIYELSTRQRLHSFLVDFDVAFPTAPVVAVVSDDSGAGRNSNSPRSRSTPGLWQSPCRTLSLNLTNKQDEP